jgi:hypothetical protein
MIVGLRSSIHFDSPLMCADATKSVTCLSELLEHLSTRQFRQQHGRWIFRGHSSPSFRLIPTIGRASHTSRTRAKFEESIFTMFWRSAGQHLRQDLTNDWDRLALAQHHGLATRLLDWSYNPMVSLYFAVEERPEEDGVLFALHAPKQISRTKLAQSPFTIDKPMKFKPRVVVPRLWVQEGLFTVHANVEEPLASGSREEWTLEEFRIPAAAKPRVRYELFRTGVHRAALFPDLDGLARHLRWVHEISPELAYGP